MWTAVVIWYGKLAINLLYEEEILMATQRRIELEADDKNRKQRNVRLYSFFSIRRFWSNVNIYNNTVITGGNSNKRMLVLEGLIRQNMIEKIPTVVIADVQANGEFDNDLIEMLKEVPGVNLIITSSTFNNYSFFEGWPISKVVDYFIACAENQNINMTSLSTYITYYLLLVEKIYGRVTLTTLREALAEWEQNSENVETLCGKLSTEDMDSRMQQIVNYLKRANEDRNAMEILSLKISDALETLATCDTGYSIVSHEFVPGDIIVIHTEQTQNFELLSLYMKYELDQMQTIPFQLIISECVNEEFLTCLDNKIKNGNTVGICVQSVRAIFGDKTQNYPFGNIVILNERNRHPAPSNIEAELALFGQFDYWQPIMAGGSPPVFFSFWTDTHAAMISTKQNKVMSQDITDCEAVLYGHKKFLSQNEIALVRNFYD